MMATATEMTKKLMNLPKFKTSKLSEVGEAKTKQSKEKRTRVTSR